MVAGIVALLAGAAAGYYVLRPLPRPATIEPEPGYLIVDSTASRSSVGDTGATAPEIAAGSKDVVLDAPGPGAVASSPLWVVGRAKGSWFFEAEFPIRLFDANDTLLTWGSARANGEWTTSDYVPFALLLNFGTPKTETGTLVLERSNPSGLPRNAAEVRIPVRFR